MSTEGGSSPVFNLNQRKYSHQKAFVVVRLRAFKRHCAGLRSSQSTRYLVQLQAFRYFFFDLGECASCDRPDGRRYRSADQSSKFTSQQTPTHTHATRLSVRGVACTWATISASSPSYQECIRTLMYSCSYASTSRSPSVSSVVVASSRLQLHVLCCGRCAPTSPSPACRRLSDATSVALAFFARAAGCHIDILRGFSVFLKQFRAT